MIQDSETDLLPILLPNLTNSNISTSVDHKNFDNNEYLMKFYKLLQCSNEYIANQLKLTQNILSNTEAEYNQIYAKLQEKANIL